MSAPRIGSLFTGYGGLDMAVEAVFGGELQWYSEIEPAACKVLLNNFSPDVPNLGDIKKIDWSTVEPVDILTGGYPCQPFSAAGLRKGTEDERHLWPYVREAIRHLRPGLVILENVRGHLTLGFDTVLGEMASVGYDARWGIVRASDAGACHQRARLFILAHPSGERFTGRGIESSSVESSTRRIGLGAESGREKDSDASNTRRWGWDESKHESRNIGPTHQQRAATLFDGHCADGSSADPDSINDGQRRRAGLDSENGRSSTGGISSENLESWFGREDNEDKNGTDWKEYANAVRRWEYITRSAPKPTVPGKNERPRLNPAFVEWMMGLPEGHVTGHGLRPAQELKMLGNGVVPQQAELAIRTLLNVI